MNNDKRYYNLRLSDGKNWGFTVNKELSPWLDSLAAIANLNKCNKTDFDINLNFVNYKSSIEPPFPGNKENWNLYKASSIYRIWEHDKSSDSFVEIKITPEYSKVLEYLSMQAALNPIYKYYTERSGGPVHAASAGFNGKGFLIAAAGDTGKSTSLERLPEYYQKMADDAALLVKNENGAYGMHPLPTWSDYYEERQESRFDLQYSLPLKAVFFLSQSNKDKVRSLKEGAAVTEIFQSFKQLWQGEWLRMDEKSKKRLSSKIFDNACELAKNIPCYELHATLNGQFWKEIEQVLL